MQKPKDVRIGVGVYIFNENNQVLLGLRQGAHGAKTWCPPGGHLEDGETAEDCAVREALEESNLIIENVTPITFTADYFPEIDRHYITLQHKATIASGELKVNEPDKISKWQWFDWDDMPDNIFLSVSNLKQKWSFDQILQIKN